jgi:ATP-dependent protease HslVU (ClpYQ) peptidase subunit
MTCIVGLVDGNKVYIGGDSASSNGHLTVVSAVPKVFSTGDFLIGYTSSWRMGQILEHHVQYDELGIPRMGQSMQAFMVQEFIESIRTALTKFGYSKIENNEETAGEFLVGCLGHLYHIESDYQVGETANGMDACGCGEQIALGALYATQNLGLAAWQRIDIALEAAAQFSCDVRPPFIVRPIG